MGEAKHALNVSWRWKMRRKPPETSLRDKILDPAPHTLCANRFFPS